MSKYNAADRNLIFISLQDLRDRAKVVYFPLSSEGGIVVAIFRLYQSLFEEELCMKIKERFKFLNYKLKYEKFYKNLNYNI